MHLDPLFIALWKPVFLVELIKHRYYVTSPDAKQNFISVLSEKIMKDRSKIEALRYLEGLSDVYASRGRLRSSWGAALVWAHGRWRLFTHRRTRDQRNHGHEDWNVSSLPHVAAPGGSFGCACNRPCCGRRGRRICYGLPPTLTVH